MGVEIEILDDPARACAAMLVGVAAGSGHVVLTGGSTPRTAYGEFVDAVRTVGVDVSGSTLWFSDERSVPPEDERSNYGMVKAALLDPLARDGGSLPTVHRMRGELRPDAAADDYERELRAAGPPRFDLVLLGIGGDGHLASMFPDQDSLSERSRLVLGVEHAGLEPYVPRVTLTFPALVNARQIVFLATGDSKAEPVAAAFGPDAKPDPHIPSSLLPPLASEVKVLLDPAAGALVRSAASGA
ncbi:MAG: 6-phosphogluconolactonase [Solirubrobacterales bacterium]|nr:6-phosphogluconolactonase [Solirubrobacterales bacterium]MBV8946398.1 6-phosphogluconolactonase [Solirubrobacterales bacterium]MBV9364908.1 6-phosphogluconolactonase [Solirubrobacterales bacterium]MBV9683392.1 6-phosphogluconolactonase [Solirubrobacterales bacterium]MBV9810782.1 6-phosphogluconolactonase [Solirubrobacterales bacterium]